MPVCRRAFRPLLSAFLSSLIMALVISSASARAEEMQLLNQIIDRHQRMHQQVSPAIVAVEARHAKRDKERERDGAKFYGTGVVVSADGLVLTSSTVVPNAARFVSVYFTDGRVMDARVVAVDEATESCVLQAIVPATDARKTFTFVELALSLIHI